MNSEVKYPPALARYLGPLLTRNGALSALVGGCLVAVACVRVDEALRAQYHRNAALALFLSVELKHESAPDLREARRIQADFIERSLVELQGPAVRLMGSLLPEYSVAGQLTPVVNTLRDYHNPAVSDREALTAAQAQLASVAGKWVRPNGDVASYWSTDVEKRRFLEREFTDRYAASLKRFIHERSARSAEDVCLNSRMLSAATLACWLDYSAAERQAKAKLLSIELSALQSRILNVARSLPETEGQLLERYAANIKSRANFYAEMQGGGFKQGRDYLVAQLTAP